MSPGCVHFTKPPRSGPARSWRAQSVRVTGVKVKNKRSVHACDHAPFTSSSDLLYDFLTHCGIFWHRCHYVRSMGRCRLVCVDRRILLPDTDRYPAQNWFCAQLAGARAFRRDAGGGWGSAGREVGFRALQPSSPDLAAVARWPAQRRPVRFPSHAEQHSAGSCGL